jgi:flagellar hook protein FlgE
MPISQSLYTAITGLSVMSDGMSVVANNIANANAKGFKKGRAEFEDMVSSDLSTGSGASQLGRGARMRSVRTLHTQGGLAVTDNITDLAVQGSGFFVLSGKQGQGDDSSNRVYTRVGSFVFDKDGYLADPGGDRVMGFMATKAGNLSSRLQEIRIETSQISPKKTDKVILDVNLDARIKPNDIEFDITNPESTSQFNNTMTVFDSHGRGHPLTVFYNRVPTSEGIEWKYHACVESKDVDSPVEGQDFIVGSSGSVKFDNKGNLLEEIFDGGGINFAEGAESNQVIELDFGKKYRC